MQSCFTLRYHLKDNEYYLNSNLKTSVREYGTKGGNDCG